MKVTALLIALTIACFYQKLPQPIPGRDYLQLPFFHDYVALAIERDAESQTGLVGRVSGREIAAEGSIALLHAH